MSKILVSVVMSVYNDEINLHRSIESILYQTYQNIEFIIINDGSTDDSLDIIKSYKKKDQRIILIDRENRGLAYSLNEGINISKGKYIARMDSDDISLPNRIHKQLIFLEKNHDIMVLGTSATYINDKIKKIIHLPEFHDDIVKFLFKSSPLIHPSVMFRKFFFSITNGYQANYTLTEDYDLWFRGRFKAKYHNIQEPLIIYSYKSKFLIKDLLNCTMIRFKNSVNLKEILKSLYWSFYQLIYLITKFLINLFDNK